MIFVERMTPKERQEICTLVYYPVEKLKLLKRQHLLTPQWYKINLKNLTELAKFLSSKYTRSKVRKALPSEFSYIIDELLHAQQDEDNNQYVYHEKILDTIIDIDSADAFIEALSRLIKRLAVDHLHIVGDIYDRGPGPHIVMDTLCEYHSVDVQWGNHDILWMGASCGHSACIANVIRIAARYGNLGTLEDGYGINLLPLASFAMRVYETDPCTCFTLKGQDNTISKAEMEMNLRIHKAISVIQFKVEGQIVQRQKQAAIFHRQSFCGDHIVSNDIGEGCRY